MRMVVLLPAALATGLMKQVSLEFDAKLDRVADLRPMIEGPMQSRARGYVVGRRGRPL